MAEFTPMPTETQFQSDRADGEALQFLQGVKIHILKDSNREASDLSAATYCLEKEDHTLGNAIRWMLMKDEDVEFCGYSLPHPSEDKLHLRIQTYDGKSSLQCLHKALVNLENVFHQIKETYQKDFEKEDFERYEEPQLDMEEINRQGQERLKEIQKKERAENRNSNAKNSR